MSERKAVRTRKEVEAVFKEDPSKVAIQIPEGAHFGDTLNYAVEKMLALGYEYEMTQEREKYGVNIDAAKA